ADHVPAALYLRAGWGNEGHDPGLHHLPAARDPRPDGGIRGLRDRAWAVTGRTVRPLRPLPVAPDRALRGDRRTPDGGRHGEHLRGRPHDRRRLSHRVPFWRDPPRIAG